MVDRVGRHVGGGVELAPGDRRVEVGEAVPDVVFLGEAREPFRVRLDRGDDVDATLRLERESMRLAMLPVPRIMNSIGFFLSGKRPAP